MKWNRLFGSFVPLKKQNPALGAILSGVGSIGSSLFSQQAQVEENQKNRDWQEMMWNKTNEYNSPKNQRKLLEEGGYNPYLYGNDYQGSGASLPSSPNSASLPGIQNPMIGAADTFQKQTALLQNQSQIESNVEMQNAKTMQTISDTLIQAYKEGGQKLYNQTYDALQPIVERMQWSGSRAELLFNEQLKDMQSARYNTDMDSLNKDLQYQLGREYSPEQIKTSIAEGNARITSILGNLDLTKKLTEQEIRTSVAEMIRNYAAAWNLKKQGELFVADAKTVDGLRDGLKKQLSANVTRLVLENGFKARDFVTGSSVYEYMSSSEGQDRLRQSASQVIEWNGSQMGFVVNKIFGEYIKVSSSANYNYGSSHSTSTSDVHSVNEIYK